MRHGWFGLSSTREADSSSVTAELYAVGPKRPRNKRLCSSFRSVLFTLLFPLSTFNTHGTHAFILVRSLLHRVPPPAVTGAFTTLRTLVSKGKGLQHPCCVSNNDNDMTAPLTPPVLELITPDGCASRDDPTQLVESVERAVAGGVSLVQLRDYRSDAKSKAALALRLRAATTGLACFVVNGEPAAARACRADGVHLPERMVDRLVGLRGAAGGWPLLVGCSVHSVTAAVKAARLGADYVQVGTMFETQSHPGKEPEGVGLLRDVRRQLEAEGVGHVLVIGVGGIDASNCGQVAAAGADGVAAIRCLCEGPEPEREASRMVAELEKALLSAPGGARSLASS